MSLAADDPRAIGGLGEALTAVAGGVVTPEAKAVFVRLAQVEPRDPRPPTIWAGPISRPASIRPALDRWRGLLAETPADAPWRPRVVEAIRAAATELRLDPDQVLAQVPAPPAAGTRRPHRSRAPPTSPGRPRCRPTIGWR